MLVDSERLAIQVESRLLTEMGWPLTPDEVAERFLGRTDAYMRAEIARRLPDLPVDWEARYDERYRDGVSAEALQPVEGVVEALGGIAAPTCVASSGTPEGIEYKLRRTGLWDRFDGRIFSAADVEHGKPAPDLFLHAAEQLGAAPAGCAVVEDSPAGLEAARAAGMRAFAYAGGVTPAERLRTADVVFDDMRQLPALLAF